MYCKNCGKYIGDDRDLCDDCLNSTATENPTDEETTPIEQENVIETNDVSTQVNKDFFPDENVRVESSTQTQAVTPQKTGKIMDGFGKALTAIILGYFGFMLSTSAVEIISSVTATSINYSETVISAIVVMFISLGIAIPSLILGIKSIGFANRAKSENRVKPIPAFVLGIVSTVFAGLAMFMCMIVMIIALFV